MGRLDGKSIVVTGSGGGIGAAYARLAADEGAAVVVCDIDEAGARRVAKQIEDGGGRALLRVADVSDWQQAEELVAFCVAETGRIDGLVNNAGIMHMAWAGDEDPGKLSRLLEVNVFGVAACGNHAIRQMRAQGSGVVLNVVSGAHFGMRYMAAYGASKGAVASLTYAWTLENADIPGIRVNAISPMGKSNINAGNEEFLRASGVRPDAGAAPQPEPEVNAPVAVFLLSDAAADVKGQIVRIDGPSLSLVAHPVVLDPVLHDAGGWTIDGVEDAFRTTFMARQVPTGMAALLKAEYVATASATGKPY